MKKKNNQGVSLIEILIAVVVFTICVTPLIAQLATTQRITQRAEQQQTATDYAKSLSETVKQMALYDSYTTAELDSIQKQMNMNSAPSIDYKFYPVTATGGKGGSFPETTVTDTTSSTVATDLYKKLNVYNSTAASKEALARTITFTGESTINYRDYDVTVTLDTKRLAVSSLTNSTVDPNAVNLHNLSSLDKNLTAVIMDTSNYDKTASNAYFNAVISALENTGDPNDLQRAVAFKNGSNKIADDATKNIIINVTEDPLASDGYKYQVICKVHYVNTDIQSPVYGSVPASACELEYEVLNQRFKDYPDIYLMYNQFMYKNIYGDDKITVKNETSQNAKVYVIRTAATNEKIKDVIAVGQSSGSLLPSAGNDRDATSSNQYVYRTIMETVKNPVEFYTNIPTTQTISGSVTSNINDSTSNRLTKMAILRPTSDTTSNIYSLEEDERYSEAGRLYDIHIEITDKDTGDKTQFDSSKGDY